jgi:hypothetical protein
MVNNPERLKESKPVAHTDLTQIGDNVQYSKSYRLHRANIYWWVIIDHEYDTVTTQITEPRPELEDRDVTVQIACCHPKVD